MRFKALVASCAAAATMVAALSGCTSQEPYSPPEPTPTISSPAIAEDGVLMVGVDAQSAPLAGTNSSGDLVGFDVDLAAALADEMGLKVEVTDVGANAESALETGAVDIVLGIEQGSSTDEVWESDPYLQTAVALFSEDAGSTVPTSESKPTVAVQTSSTSSWMVENEFGASALERTNGLTAAFEAMASGDADYVAADAVRGTYALSDESLGIDASIIALMHQPSGYCVAVAADNTQLQQAVEDALANIVDGGMITVLDKKWLGEEWDLDSIPLTAGATSNTRDEKEDEADSTDDAAKDDSADNGGSSTEGDTGGNALTPEEIAAS